MCAREDRDDAHRCLPMVLRMRELQDGVASSDGRLLRFLLIRYPEVPTPPSRAGLVLRRLIWLDFAVRRCGVPIALMLKG
jgi:hypothetical protein